MFPWTCFVSTCTASKLRPACASVKAGGKHRNPKINGRNYQAEYEARTTLWEVIAVKLGLTGTNRSCNRASCGACSVLLDGTPFYSCHTLAMEAAGKRIFTVEGLGDERNLHPLQKIGYLYMAADCGFCTAGWEVTAKVARSEEHTSELQSRPHLVCRLLLEK